MSILAVHGGRGRAPAGLMLTQCCLDDGVSGAVDVRVDGSRCLLSEVSTLTGRGVTCADANGRVRVAPLRFVVIRRSDQVVSAGPLPRVSTASPETSWTSVWRASPTRLPSLGASRTSPARHTTVALIQRWAVSGLRQNAAPSVPGVAEERCDHAERDGLQQVSARALEGAWGRFRERDGRTQDARCGIAA